MTPPVSDIREQLDSIWRDAERRPATRAAVQRLRAEFDRIGAIGPAAAELSARCPDSPLIIDGEGTSSVAEIHDEARRLASFLLASGLAPGDVISMMLPNWHEACVINLAAAMAGLVLNPLIPAFRDAELRFILEDSGSRLLFLPERFRGYDYRSLAERIRPHLPALETVIIVRGDASGPDTWNRAVAADIAERTLPAVDPHDPKWLLYTSGTTGHPKGVIHSHATIGLEILALQHFWAVSEADTFLVPSPVGHIGGALYAFEFPWVSGSSAVLLDVWDPETAFDLLETHDCTKIAGATPFLSQLLEVSKTRGRGLPRLDLFICGGAAVSQALIEEATARLGQCHVTRVYGSTEVPTVTVGTPRGYSLRHCAETDGQIGLADVRIVDRSSGEAVATGEEGEILVRAPHMFMGYVRPDDTDAAFDSSGYFHTGDLAIRDEEDFLTITGRIKDLIIRAGENISPKEVEDHLCAHPLIHDAAVVGAPDPRTGEKACAFLVTDQGAPCTVAEVGAFLQERGLAKFKLPERVTAVAELPRNASGKVRKDVLRELAAQEAPPRQRPGD